MTKLTNLVANLTNLMTKLTNLMTKLVNLVTNLTNPMTACCLLPAGLSAATAAAPSKGAAVADAANRFV